MATSAWPLPSRAARIAATWPSIMPLGPTMSAPADAWATAICPYRSRVASLSTSPDSVSSPQWPWSVYSSRHRSAMSTVAPPTSADRSARADVRIPAGSSAAEPRASLTAGTPKIMSPPTPASTASAAALRSLSRVCWTTPGMELTGCGSRIPSLTNIGSTRSDGWTLVWATRRRSAAVRRSLRGRAAGNSAVTAAPWGLSQCWWSQCWLPQAAAGAAAALAWLPYGLARGDGRVADARPVFGERVHQGRGRGFRCGHVHPEPELGRGARGLRPDNGDHRDRVRLPGDADQVPHRG